MINNTAYAPHAATHTRPEGDYLSGARRAVIFDDDVSFSEECAEALRRQGYSVESCVREAYFSATIARFAPEMLLLDLHIPDFDGIEALRSLKTYERKNELDVILISAAHPTLIASASALAEAYGIHLRGVLRKPFRLAQLELMAMPR